MNLYPVTIIEDFYDNPDKIRQFALSQNYMKCRDRKNFDYVYPGGRTKDLVDLDNQLHSVVCRKLISIFHNSENDVMRWAISTNFQSVTHQYNQGIIHTDEGTVFAGVLYLTPNAPLDSGTSIWTKNKSFNQAKYIKALERNTQKFKGGSDVMDVSYHDMFNEVIRVNNVYNTLILYEGRHFHSANKFFGNNLQDSRLTQVFFINKIDAQRYSSFPVWRSQQVKV